VIVLDTHAWLWWVSRPSELSAGARKVIDSADVVGVSAISAWEAATPARKRRFDFDRPVGDWMAAALAVPRVRELPVTAAIGAAGSFGSDFPGDPADRIIAATALAHGAPLVTKNDALRTMEALQTVW
jgi:PIN domain nuclease of toxin-antitoxin system